MALEDIFVALEQQADKEIEEILQDARDHAKAIAEDAVEQAAEIRASRIEHAEKATRARASQSVNAAKMESKKRVAGVKERGVGAAFEAALESLAGVRENSGYPSVFRALAAEALHGIEGDPEVHVDPADAELAKATLAELKVDAPVHTDLSTAGGLVVSTHDGRIKRRNTLEDRLDKVRQSAQADVAEIIFS